MASSSEPHCPEISRRLEALLLVMITGGLILRAVDLGFPPGLSWDEHHFVENARNYLSGRPDWNDHPPLGKLMMALSIDLLGDRAFAFRLPSLILGSLSVFLAGVLSARVFQSRLAGLLAAAFLAADGFFIAYSRTALLDGMLACITLAALCLMTFRGAWATLLTGLLIGFGMAIKMSAVVLIGPFFALMALKMALLTPAGQAHLGEFKLFGVDARPEKLEVLAYPLAAVLAVFAYLSWWSVGLSLAGQPSTLSDAIAATEKMMAHHAKLTDWKHPLLSRWWTWPLPTRPIMLRYDRIGDGWVRIMTSMGNPLIWWGASVSVLVTLAQSFKALSARHFGALATSAFLLLAFAAYISPWIVTNRDSYIYHYLPAYGVGIVLFSGLLAGWAKSTSAADDAPKNARLFYGVLAIAIVSAVYSPVWAQLPVPEIVLKYWPFVG